MGRILITSDYLVPHDAVDALLRAEGHETVHAPFRGPRPARERAALFDGIDGAILASEPVTAAELAGATRLRVIARSGVGFDSIDLAAAAAHGVRVTNAPGANHDSVAELALGLMIAAARRLPEIVAEMRGGGWERRAGHELRGATLAVVGFGPSGRAMASFGAALGMRVLVVTSHPDDTPGIAFVPLEAALAAADYVSLHGRASHGGAPLIDAGRLAAMKPTAVLINTARGSLVDEDALVSALRAGTLGAAALDVYAAEPLAPSSPLRTLPNAIVVPHIAGQTEEARLRAGTMAARGVIDVLAGREPEFPVDSPGVTA